MSLYSDSRGSGAPLLLLHGWGIGGNIWENVQEKLQAHCTVTWVDLPGYGRSPNTLQQRYTLENLATSLAPLLEPSCNVLGWSLGGMVAMQLALQYPEKIKKLILTATSPQFFSGPDWPHAMEKQTLDKFGTDLKLAYRDTVLQFLAVQAIGSESARDEIRTLRQRVFRDGEPCHHALEQGLYLLQTENLRAHLTQIHCPTLIIAGERDRLAPLAASQAMQELIPNARLHCVKGTSHGPFLSHLDEFAEQIEAFIYE
ncbi:MAG: pimeloyl-ACP methyl ester esterase BioH [Gammaproteobacteria bacterium]|nr:pimeloyl-ACP methyl ester esterase BioH [Gammaproteobacteria bacterium]MDH5799596.1 pimeloyl-ACP methyl ester esterase BioH [Gammaproteobacteria bacterium]